MTIKLLKLLVVTGIAVLLSGCGTIISSVGTSTRADILAYHESGSAYQCKQALFHAYKQLNAARQSHAARDVFLDWDAIYAHLADAIAAQQHRDYNLCVSKSQQVMTAIERDKNYQRWKRSLNP